MDKLRNEAVWTALTFLTILFTTFTGLSFLFGVPLITCLKYIIYVAGVDLIPGYLFLRLFGWPRESLGQIVLSLPIGLALESFSTLGMKMLQLTELTPISPAIGLILLLMLLRQKTVEKPFSTYKMLNTQPGMGNGNSQFLSITLTSILCAGIVVLLWLQCARPPYFMDANFRGATISTGIISTNWPFRAYPLDETRFSYCYMLYMHTAGAVSRLNVETLHITARMAPIISILSLMATTIWLGLSRFRLGVFIVLPLIQIFASAQPSDFLSSTLVHVMGPSISRSYTGTFAVSIFMILFAVLLEKTTESLSFRKKFLITIFLGFVMAGSRPLAIPVFLAALGTLFLYRTLKNKKFDTECFVLGSSLLVELGIGLFLFYGIGESNTNLTAADRKEVFALSPLVPYIGFWGSAIISYLFRFTFLAPAHICTFFKWKTFKLKEDFVFGVGATLGSIICIPMIDNPGRSEYKSLFYGHIILALTAAYLFTYYYKNRKEHKKTFLVLLLTGLMFFAGHAYDTVVSLPKRGVSTKTFFSQPKLFSRDTKLEIPMDHLESFWNEETDYFITIPECKLRYYRQIIARYPQFIPYYQIVISNLYKMHNVTPERRPLVEKLNSKKLKEDPAGVVEEMLATLRPGARIHLIWLRKDAPQLESLIDKADWHKGEYYMKTFGPDKELK